MNLESVLQNPELPVLPESLIRLLELISTDAPLTEISNVIGFDPALTARTLELANSAWYKRENSVDNVSSAIQIIGISTLYLIIFSSSVTRKFEGISTDLVNMSVFWKQSIRMAVAAQMLASKNDLDAPLRSYTAGMLAYIGKLALYTSNPQESQEILLLSRNKLTPHFSAEQQVLGFSHCDISAGLMKKWKFPDSMSIPIQFYMRPLDAPQKYRESAAILFLAHYLQYTFAGDFNLTDPLHPLDPKIMELLGISEGDLPYIARETQNSVLNTITMLNIS